MAEAIYKGKRSGFVAGTGLPEISTALDSVRAYQFEVHFEEITPGVPQSWTLAAKQVSQVGFSVEDIVVDRVNDKMYYPGKASPEEITITFDNLYHPDVSEELFDIFKDTYDPMTGEIESNAPPAGNTQFKANKMSIYTLKNDSALHQVIECYGVYMKSWKSAEFNYSTNDFHTIECVFRYDFMNVLMA